MFCRVTTFVLPLLLAPLMAQEPPLPKALVEVGRTTARGGNCARILLSGDGRHMLTVGEAGDLLWWDLAEQRLLRRIAGKGRFVSAIALHPTEPWAVVSTSLDGRWRGSVWRCDLDTGAVHDLWADYTPTLAFDAAGELLCADLRIDDHRNRRVVYRSRTVRAGEPLVEEAGPFPTVLGMGAKKSQEATSPDGRLSVRCDGDKLFHSGGARPEIRIDDVETWLNTVAVANERTVAAADLQGCVHVRTPADQRMVFAGHTGPAHRLVFSPDGRFLAVVGLGATRVVDLEGKDIVEWTGTRIVLAGPDGADFWIFDRRGLRRWSASTRRDVAPAMRWETPELRVVRSLDGRPFALLAEENPPFWLFSLGTACVVDGVPWLGGDRFHPAQPRHFVEGGFERVGPELPAHLSGLGSVALVALANGLVMSVASVEGDDVGNPPLSLVELHRGAGAPVVSWKAESCVRRVAVDPANGDVVLGFVGDEVKTLDGATLTEVGARRFETGLRDMAFFDRGRVLAAFGKELLLLDAHSLRTLAAIAVPADIPRIDVVAVSPTRRHVALAYGSEVRILRVE